MLDKKFIAERKQDLLKQKDELEKELSNIALKKDSNYTPKFPSFGNEPEENELEVEEFDENVDAEKKLNMMLEETDKALGNIEKNTYGICEKCHKEIDRARLKAYPAATACIDCEKMIVE